MLARAYTAGLLGVDGFLITVEADVRPGLPCLTLVGRASGAASESRERVRSALAHCGHDIRPRRQVVNLAPAQQRKDEAGMDLAIAVALCRGHGVIPEPDDPQNEMFWGELALDGTLRACAGTLVVADCARMAGLRRIYVPPGSANEAALIPGLEVIAVETLAELVALLRGEREESPHHYDPPVPPVAVVNDDMADVRGLHVARLALEVMVAGGHNLLLFGPPGVGKTMLARRAASLFPPLSREAALEVTKIHGVARGVSLDGLLSTPPLRAPHHSVSTAGLLGGGTPPRPGEVSLAHHGLLFLDELPEFPRAALEGLREPLEDRELTIVRARNSVRFPASFQLMAAMNPCPCGYLGHPERVCTDSASAVARYRSRLSGPLLDRMDLVAAVHPASRAELAHGPPGESSRSIRERIVKTRQRQAERLAQTPWTRNADVPARGDFMNRYCALDRTAHDLLDKLAAVRRLSPRAQHRMRRVARTIADLRDPDGGVVGVITGPDMAQASHLRRLPDQGLEATG